MIYYLCTKLCTSIPDGVPGNLKAVPFYPGPDFQVVSVCFDPRDAADLASSNDRRIQDATAGPRPTDAIL